MVFKRSLLTPIILLAVTATGAFGLNRYSVWLADHPIAKDWFEENNYESKENVKDFESGSTKAFFALGCHRLIFGGRNFRRLYDDNTVASGSDHTGTNPQTTLKESASFGESSGPLLGCSTAYIRGSKIYEYELALRQGERGFVERISVHQDKIISQLIFLEKNIDGKKVKIHGRVETPPYKFVFGLYKYIKQNYQDTNNGNKKIYKVANPDNKQWSELDVTSVSNDTPITPTYYTIWQEDPEGEGMFDNLGVKSNDKLFSSVVKSNPEGGTASDFIYFSRSRFSSKNVRNQPQQKEHYSLSVLDSLSDDISNRKGSWTSIENYCNQKKSEENSRIYINEIKRIAHYCYAIKKAQTATVVN